MGLIENKQELFNIAEKFKNKTVTPEDVLRLATILCYALPYPSEYFSTVRPEELTIEQEYQEADSNGKITLGSHKESIQSTTLNSENRAKIQINTISSLTLNADYLSRQSFYEVIDTIAHEMRHELQSKLLRQNLLDGRELSPEMQDVVDAYAYGNFNQRSLGNLLKLAYVLDGGELSPEQIDKFINSKDDDEFFSKFVPSDSDKTSKAEVEFLAYRQLKYEEDARITGANFAFELFYKMVNDEMCPEEIKDYLEENFEEADSRLKTEREKIDSANYQDIRQLYMKAKNLIDNTSTKTIEDLLNNRQIDYILKQQIADLKLHQLRQSNTDMATYYRGVCSFRLTPTLSVDKPSYYYLAGCNPKEIMLKLLKEIGKEYDDGLNMRRNPLYGERAIGNLNFINPSDPIYLQPDEIVDLCLYWIEQSNYTPISSLVSGIKYACPSNDAENERYAKISKAILSSKKIQQKIKDKTSIISQILDKKPEDMLYEELAILEKVYYGYQTLNQNSSEIDKIAAYLGTNVETCITQLQELRDVSNISESLQFKLNSKINERLDFIKWNNLTKTLKINSKDNILSNPLLIVAFSKIIKETQLFANYSTTDLESYIKNTKYNDIFFESTVEKYLTLLNDEPETYKEEVKELEKKFIDFIYAPASSSMIHKICYKKHISLKEFNVYLDCLEKGDIDDKFTDIDNALKQDFIVKYSRKLEIDNLYNSKKIDVITATIRSGKCTIEEVEELYKLIASGNFPENGSRGAEVRNFIIEQNKIMPQENKGTPIVDSKKLYLEYLNDNSSKIKTDSILKELGLKQKDFKNYIELLQNEDVLPAKLSKLEDRLKDTFAIYSAKKQLEMENENDEIESE